MDISQTRGIILFITAFINLIFTLFLWFKGKDRATFHLGWVAFFSAVYSFTYGGLFFFEQNKLFWGRATWLGVLILPAYITFVYYFTERTKYLKLKSFLWYLGAIIISYLSLTTPYFIEKVFPEYPYEIAETPGVLDPLGRIYIIICLTISLFYLIKEYFKAQGFRKSQIKYFIWGMSIYTLGGILAAGVIPLFYPAFTYIDIPAYLSIFWVALTTYAIFSKKLFEIKVILTEFLVGVMGVVLAVLPFFMPNVLLKILTSIIFVLFLIFGYYLIRYTHREARQKEILEEKVKERTKELETAKNIAEEKTKETERRKEELERVLKAVVGRELRMIELKKEIKELKEKLEQ